jgi:hypothetical protein
MYSRLHRRRKACGADASTADNAGHTLVFMTAQNGHTETVRALVWEFGADASTADNDGCTPVWTAAFNGHTETVRALAQECGADANTVNKATRRRCGRWCRSAMPTPKLLPSMAIPRATSLLDDSTAAR